MSIKLYQKLQTYLGRFYDFQVLDEHQAMNTLHVELTIIDLPKRHVRVNLTDVWGVAYFFL